MRLFTSLQQNFLNLRRGTPGPLPPPVASMADLWSPMEQAGVEHTFREAVIGSPATVKRGIAAFLQRTGVDELMVTAAMYDQRSCGKCVPSNWSRRPVTQWRRRVEADGHVPRPHPLSRAAPTGQFAAERL